MRLDRRPLTREDHPVRPAGQAASQLRFIREMMARTGEFTAVPGVGGIAMGCTALVAAYLAEQQATPVGWMRVWTLEAMLGFVVGATAIWWKASRHSIPLLSGQGRKFLLCLAPAIAAGMALTLAIYGFDVGPTEEFFVRRGRIDATATLKLLPGLWLLLYGAGVVSAGVFSVRPVPLFGACLMMTGIVALLTPAAWGNLWMAVGFGGLHIVFGIVIAQRYGG